MSNGGTGANVHGEYIGLGEVPPGTCGRGGREATFSLAAGRAWTWPCPCLDFSGLYPGGGRQKEGD